MPQQDRTGPMGQGPKTGRGLGKCGKVESVQGSNGVGRSENRMGDGTATGRRRRKRCGGRNGRCRS